ncbi:MAG: DNA primase [Gemmatimonadetes bacterium]|nr:DNA primase [Gemmatimonadota bacterium]
MPRNHEAEAVRDRIRDATDIVDLVSEHVQLTRRGRNFLGLCPFHEEKTPSFSVNPDRQFYHCFGCGAGGDVFKFIQEIDRVTFIEAIKFLAERAGIALPERSGPSREETEAADELYRANDLAQKYFHHLLLNDEVGASASEYLQTRRLTSETIERFGLGYAPPGWDALLKVAGRRGLSPQTLEQAGLALPRSTGSGHYDRFRDRVAFPIANLSDRTIAFGARALQPDQEPKYLNSPETPIYHKGRVLYGLSIARDTIRRQDAVLVVEGYMDLISLAQAGIQHVVATSGTALTEDHCRLLARFARQVVLLFDGDAAGSTAAIRGLTVLLGTGLPSLAALLSKGLDVRFISLPAEHDPDSFVQEHGPDALLKRAENAQSVLDFYLEQLSQQHDLSSFEGRSSAVETFKPLIAKLNKPEDLVFRDLLLRNVAQRLPVDEKFLRDKLQASMRPPQQPRQAVPEPSPTDAPEPPRHEIGFIGLLLNFPQFISQTVREFAPDSLSDARTQTLCRTIFDHHAQGKAINIGMLISELEDDALARLAAQCAAQGFDEEQVERQWRDYLLYFQKNALQKRIANARQALAAASDEDEIARISAELVALNQERQAVATQQSS